MVYNSQENNGLGLQLLVYKEMDRGVCGLGLLSLSVNNCHFPSCSSYSPPLAFPLLALPLWVLEMRPNVQHLVSSRRKQKISGLTQSG